MKTTASFAPATPTADTQPSSTTAPAPAPTPDGPIPAVGLVAVRANPKLPFGGVRVMTLDHGVLRIIDRNGHLAHEIPTDGLTVRPTRMGNLHLTWSGGAISINPISEGTIVTKAVHAVFVRELEMGDPYEEVTVIRQASADGLGGITLKPLRALMEVRRAIVAVLEEHGATVA